MKNAKRVILIIIVMLIGITICIPKAYAVQQSTKIISGINANTWYKNLMKMALSIALAPEEEDKTGPEIKFTTNGSREWKTEQGSVVTVTDDKKLDEGSLRYVWTQSTNQPQDEKFVETFRNGTKITNNTETGNNWYLWVMAKDASGNKSYKRSDAFYLDNTDPTVPTFQSNFTDNVWKNGNATLKITGSTNASGIAKYQYHLNSQDWNDFSRDLSFTNTGVYIVYAKAIGNTGLESDVVQFTIKVDNNNPIINGILDNVTYASAKATIEDESKVTAKIKKNSEAEKEYKINQYNVGEVISETGNYTLTVTDEAKNTSTVTFKINSELPEITYTPDGNDEWQTSQTTRVTVTSGSSLDKESFKYIWGQNVTVVTEKLFEKGQKFISGQEITKADGSGKFSLLIMAKDTLGNVAFKKSQEFYIDNTVPEAPIISGNIGDGGITSQTVELKISGSASLSGIKKYQYKVDEQEWQDGNSITISDAGSHKVKARAVSGTDIISKETSEYTFTINKTAPTVTFSPNGNQTWERMQTSTILVESENVVVQEKLRYMWSKSTEAPSEEDFTDQFYIEQKVKKDTESGIWYIWVLAEDRLGNKTITKSEGFYLDNDTPTKPSMVTTSGNGEWLKKGAAIQFTGGESASGIKKYRYSIDEKYSWHDMSTLESLSFDEDGTYKIYVKAINNVGREGEIAGPYTIKVDNTAPKITGVKNNTKYRKATPIVQDANEVNVVLKKDGKNISYKANTTISEPGQYELIATDEAGNESRCTFEIAIDAPSVNITPNGNNKWAKTISVKVDIEAQTELDTANIKYKWTQDEGNITEADFAQGAITFTNGETLEKTEGSGNWYLCVIVKDVDGETTIFKSNKFLLDNEVPTAPTITSRGEGNKKVISIVGGESPSGIAKYQYSTDNGESWKDLAVGDTLTLENVGTYNIIARAVNNVGTEGQQSAVYTVTIAEIPIITFNPNGNSSYKKVQKTVVEVQESENITEAKYLWSQKSQGVTKEEIQNSFTNNTEITKDTESGIWYLWIYAVDKKGEDVISRSEGFYLDNDMPIIEGVKDGQTYEEKVIPSITDLTSKVEVKVTKDGEIYKYTEGNYLIENGQYELIATDEAGNTASVTFTLQNIPEGEGSHKPGTSDGQGDDDQNNNENNNDVNNNGGNNNNEQQSGDKKPNNQGSQKPNNNLYDKRKTSTNITRRYFIYFSNNRNNNI